MSKSGRGVVNEVGISGLREVVEVDGTVGARVFNVLDEPSGRRVVIRVLRSRLDEADLAAFVERQDRIESLRRHPNIARVLTHGINASGLPFVVTEPVEGITVDRVLDRGRRLELADALRASVRAAGALESLTRVATRSGLLGPADVSLDQSGQPVFSGLGIVERASIPAVAMARPDHLAFLAPELIGGDAAGPRSDVYALGALLYALLTGTAPFVEDGITREVLNRIVDGQLADLRSRLVPGPVAELVERAMATSPADRFADALEFGKACQQTQLAIGIDATRILVKRAPTEDAAATLADPESPAVEGSPGPDAEASPTIIDLSDGASPTPAAVPSEFHLDFPDGDPPGPTPDLTVSGLWGSDLDREEEPLLILAPRQASA